MKYLIETARKEGASDLHLVYGSPPKLRIHGSLRDFPGAAPLTDEDCERYARELLQPDGGSPGTPGSVSSIPESGFDVPGSVSDIREGGFGVRSGAAGRGVTPDLPVCGEVDAARTISGTRVRINIFRQQGHLSAAVRLLYNHIPDISELGLPAVAEELTSLRRGIILVTGETGSGKSTTLAAMLDKLNHSVDSHIVTLEDPIEYVYTPDRCLINQREIGKDAEGFAQGLRAALREDPDILLIGEMRDADTIETALTAAETGHLVFATLHTNSASDTIDRIVSVFSSGRQQQIRMQLSMTLQAVLSQQLLPRADGTGRVLACEVMKVIPAIRNLIREGKTPQIENALSTSAKIGNITMDNSIIRLCQKRLITAEEAVAAAHDGEYVSRSCLSVSGLQPGNRGRPLQSERGER